MQACTGRRIRRPPEGKPLTGETESRPPYEIARAVSRYSRIPAALRNPLGFEEAPIPAMGPAQAKHHPEALRRKYEPDPETDVGLRQKDETLRRELAELRVDMERNGR